MNAQEVGNRRQIKEEWRDETDGEVECVATHLVEAARVFVIFNVSVEMSAC